MHKFARYLEELRLTLKYHSKLNPAIWRKGAFLSDDDTDYLLSKAWEFVKFSGVSKDRVSDIVFTGSNANFNYTKFSDVDLHIMCDEHGFDSQKLYEKKVEWTVEHQGLKLGRYPIEMYIQDKDERWPKGQGVYSLMQRKWLVEPIHLGHIDVLDDLNTEQKVDFEIKFIKDLLKVKRIEPILEYKERLWKLRSAGLERGGEFSVENVVYKDLRNRGLIEKLNKHLHELKHAGR